MAFMDTNTKKFDFAAVKSALDELNAVLPLMEQDKSVVQGEFKKISNGDGTWEGDAAVNARETFDRSSNVLDEYYKSAVATRDYLQRVYNDYQATEQAAIRAANTEDVQ